MDHGNASEYYGQSGDINGKGGYSLDAKGSPVWCSDWKCHTCCYASPNWICFGREDFCRKCHGKKTDVWYRDVVAEDAGAGPWEAPKGKQKGGRSRNNTQSQLDSLMAENRAMGKALREAQQAQGKGQPSPFATTQCGSPFPASVDTAGKGDPH